MIRPTSLAHFARDVAHAAGVLTDYATENRRLRERNRALEIEVTRLSQILLGAAGTSRDDLMDLADAVAEPELTADEVEALGAEFHAAKYLGDVLWVMGGDVR